MELPPLSTQTGELSEFTEHKRMIFKKNHDQDQEFCFVNIY